MSRQRRSRHNQRGFSLAEIATAVAVFAIIFIAALMIYDRSNKMFSQNAQAAEMQQTTRVAFEKLVQDVRLAGFDYKRGGIPSTNYPVWKKAATYVVGQMIVPNVNNGHIYRCTTGGTSGATPPVSWSTTSAATVNDNGVVWQEAGSLTAAFDQPDEQVEYAWTSAIAMRGNYDYDQANDSSHYDHGRESTLESTQFPVVTTGNHEIITYVLV